MEFQDGLAEALIVAFEMISNGGACQRFSSMD